MHVALCTPSTGLCRTAYAYSLARLVMYVAMHRMLPEVPDQELSLLMLEGSGISANREQMVEDALSKPTVTHVLFIDEDMGFAPDTLHVLARRRQAIVGCNYPMRVPPPQFTALAMNQRERVITTATSTGLEPAYYIGFGFTLIERRVFEALTRPRFLIGYNTTAQRYTTEDHPFCRKAREAGFTVYVDHDASRQVFHVGNHNYSWREVTDGNLGGTLQPAVPDAGTQEPTDGRLRQVGAVCPD